MQVSVESINALERKVTIGVPAERVDTAVNARLVEVARDVRLDGFRQGKVPMKVVRSRFGAGAREEVLGKVMNDTFYEAIEQENLKPAGMPAVEPVNDKTGEDFEYTATFEVYPEITLQDFSGVAVTRLQADITKQDIDDMVENLRTQQSSFAEVKRAAKAGDQVNIDYNGTKDGEAFAGGQAEGQDLELGSGGMIAGFESGIEGMKAGEEKVLALSFPDDYHAEELKGAAVEFAVKLHSVSEKTLPELDDELFKQFGVEEGGVEAFREKVKENMQREMKQAADNKLKQEMYDGLGKIHDFAIPQALIDQEIKGMRQNMVQQFGAAAQNMDLEALLPAEMFQDQAKSRVQTGLIMNEIVTVKELKADGDKVRAKIEEMAEQYGEPEQLINHYYSNQNLLNQVESIVLEDLVVEAVLAGATVTEEQSTYKDVIAPPAQPEPEESADSESE